MAEQRDRKTKLKGCLVFWDAEKGRYRITTPKTARAAQKFKADAVFLLTDTLDPKDAKDIALFQQVLAESDLAACFTTRGPVTYEALKSLGVA